LFEAQKVEIRLESEVRALTAWNDVLIAELLKRDLPIPC